jgi:hypothetical protein
MKKFIKGCIIAGLVCLLAGGGMATASVAMGGNLLDVAPRLKQWGIGLGALTENEFWNNSGSLFDSENDEFGNNDELFLKDEDELFNEQENQIYSGIGIQELDADLMVGKVRIIDDSVGDEITIDCNKDSSFYKVEDKDGELNLKTYPGNGYRKDSNILFTIHVPENYQFTKVKINIAPTNNKVGKGSLKSVGVVARAISADELSLNVTAGVANIKQGNVGKLIIDSEAGAVNYSGNVLERALIDCEASAINMQLEGEKEDFSYKVDSELGVVKLGDESISVLGKKELENPSAPKSMDLKCEVSAVKISFLNQV